MADRTQAERPFVAIVLSFLAAVWMIWMAINMSSWASGDPYGWLWSHGMMRVMMPALWWPAFGFISGLLVLVGAVLLYAQPKHARIWGILISVVSAFNFFIGMGGFIAGLLGVVGGILAATSVEGNHGT